MKYVKWGIAAVVLGIVVFAATAKAADKPIVDISRLSLAAGANYAWHSQPFVDGAPPPAFGKEWEFGIYGAYNLTPHLSIAGSSVYGLDNKLVESRLGLRFRLWRGGGGE